MKGIHTCMAIENARHIVMSFKMYTIMLLYHDNVFCHVSAWYIIVMIIIIIILSWEKEHNALCNSCITGAKDRWHLLHQRSDCVILNW